MRFTIRRCIKCRRETLQAYRKKNVDGTKVWVRWCSLCGTDWEDQPKEKRGKRSTRKSSQRATEPPTVIAKMEQPCPECPDKIEVGDEIVKTSQGWVHKRCYLPPSIKKEMNRMDEDFRKTIKG